MSYEELKILHAYFYKIEQETSNEQFILIPSRLVGYLLNVQREAHAIATTDPTFSPSFDLIEALQELNDCQTEDIITPCILH